MANDDDNTGAVDGLIPYDEWMIDGMRRIIYLALWQTAEYGLPGDHHFYITFKTQHPQVLMSPNLKARFADEMRIVVQHQYGSLTVHEDNFSITLQFGGVPEVLVIPYAAISQFVDPSVHFALDFEVEIDATEPEGTSTGPRLVNTDGNVMHISTGPSKDTEKQQKSKPVTADQASSATSDHEAGSTTHSTDDETSDGNKQNVVTLDAFRHKKKED